MHPVSALFQNPRHTAFAAGGALALLGAAAWVLLRKRPTADELEARRRTRLAAVGRISDGSLIDARPGFERPETIVYSYRIAGVAYECNQDVSAFAGGIVLPALNLPIQVRYDAANPGDSIVVAESWNGLWILGGLSRTSAKSENSSNNAALH